MKSNLEGMTPLEKKHEENLSFLSGLNIEGSGKWMRDNLGDKAIAYIRNAESDIKSSIERGDKNSYSLAWERYYKAWLRVWQLMAEEHMASRDIGDVDMRYFRHAKDGTNFVMEMNETGDRVLVLPRKPTRGKQKMKYITAGEMLSLKDMPIASEFIEKFDAWFKR